MAGSYIADRPEKPALVEGDAILIGDSTVTGAGSGKKHLPKQSATASSVALRTGDGRLKAADGDDDDDLVTMKQKAAESSKVVRLSRALAKDPDVGDAASIFADFKSQGFGLGSTDGIDEAKTDLELFNNSSRTSSGWRFNSRGQLEEVAAGMPRYNYDPATGEPQGILIEEQRTNLFPRSSRFIEGQGWAKVDGSPMANPPTDFPNSITVSNSVEVNAVRANTGELAGNTWTISAILSDVSGSIYARFSGSSQSLVKIKDLAGGLSLWSATMDVVYDLNVGATGISWGADSSFNLHHMQIERGSFATSPIITNGTTVTRTADIVGRTLGAEWNPNEGTFVVEFKTASLNQHAYAIDIGDGTPNNRFIIRKHAGVGNFGVEVSIRQGGVDNSSVDTTVDTRDGVKVAVSIESDGTVKFSANGNPIKTLSTKLTTMNLFNHLRVGGSQFGVYLNGTISCVKYEPRAVSDAELQELSRL